MDDECWFREKGGSPMLDEYDCGEIYIRHAVDKEPDEKYFEMHIHDRCEIYFFISGRVNYLVESTEYFLEEKSLVIMRPAEAHKARIVKRFQYERYAINFPMAFVLTFDPRGYLLRAFTERALGKNNYYGPEELDMKLVERMFEEMLAEKEDDKRQLTLTIHLLFLLGELNRAFAKKSRTDEYPQSQAGKIVSYVNHHLFEPLSVSALAEHFYLSCSQFGRIFKEATGAPPWEYIVRKRLTVAKEKIRNGLPAQKAAEKCGFGNYSAFYRAYVGYFGCSPMEEKNRKSHESL